MTPDQVNHSQAGNVFMLGAGGIFIVILSAYLGRLPVMFWFLIVSTATAAWCAGAKTFESFMAARILNGFFSTVAQVSGLMFIQDMFYFHERARKINIWASFFVISPYMGPLLAAFMLTTQEWPIPCDAVFADVFPVDPRATLANRRAIGLHLTFDVMTLHVGKHLSGKSKMDVENDLAGMILKLAKDGFERYGRVRSTEARAAMILLSAL